MYELHLHPDLRNTRVIGSCTASLHPKLLYDDEHCWVLRYVRLGHVQGDVEVLTWSVAVYDAGGWGERR
jgi:hypothetical protein